LHGENSHFSLKCEKETEDKKRQQHSHIETLILKRGIFVVPVVDDISRFFGRKNNKKYSQDCIRKVIKTRLKLKFDISTIENLSNFNFNLILVFGRSTNNKKNFFLKHQKSEEEKITRLCEESSSLPFNAYLTRKNH
jgi:hypothetical protein